MPTTTYLPADGDPTPDGWYTRPTADHLPEAEGYRQYRGVFLPNREYPRQIRKGQRLNHGFWTDHQDDRTREACYLLRMQGTPHRDIAARLGLRWHLDSYRACDVFAGRLNRPRSRGREVHAGDADHRNVRFVASRNLPWMEADTAPASYDHRRFGIELEFGHDDARGPYDSMARERTGRAEAVRTEIEEAARQAGIDLYPYWREWNLDPRQAHRWQACYDSTVTGAEIVSPVMTGDNASLDEVRNMINLISDAGGHAARSQGLHVHHDASDFTPADLDRLLTNLEHVEGAMSAYVFQPRTRGEVGCSAIVRTRPNAGRFTNTWADARHNLANGRPCNDHGERYTFFNLEHLAVGAGCRVEFRGMGNSMNPAKIRTWVRVGQAVMAATVEGHVFPAHCTTEQLLAGCVQHGKLALSQARRWLNRVGAAAAAA